MLNLTQLIGLTFWFGLGSALFLLMYLEVTAPLAHLITITRPAVLLHECCGTEPLLVRVLPQLTLLSPSLLACPPQDSSLLLQLPDNLRVSNKIKILLGMHKLHLRLELFLRKLSPVFTGMEIYQCSSPAMAVVL